MASFGNEVRLALRRLARTPFFTGIVILTLGVGIGANSAIFAVVNGVLLEPLPYPDAEQLVGVWHKAPGAGFEDLEMSVGTYLTYREFGGAVFEDIGMWRHDEFTIAGPGEPERVTALRVTDGVLPILGVQPLFGRNITEADTRVDAPLVLMLTHGFWQRHFAGARDVIGQVLRINGLEAEIIGVLPGHLRLSAADVAVYAPFSVDPSEASLGGYSHIGIARLRAGASVEQANAEIERLIPILAERYPGVLTLEQLRDSGFGANVRPYRQDVIGDVGDVLWVLLGAVGGLLLIACANVANLFVVRADGRTRDVAVHIAMGASQRRIAIEFLTESVLLGLGGGAVGAMLAFAGTRLLVRIAPSTLPRLDNIAIDPPVLVFTLVTSIVAGLVFGAFPLFRFRAPNLLGALREGGRGGSAGRQKNRVRNALVITQVSLALVLLVGSGLLVRTFAALRNVHPGFSAPSQVLTFGVAIPSSEIADPLAAGQTHERILERLAALPGVVRVGAANAIPMSGDRSNDVVEIDAFPTAPGDLPPVRRITFVAPGYFETLGSSLVAGRTIEWSDIHDQRQVVVVSENFARAYWTDPSDALGRRIRASFGESWFEIIGVHRDMRIDGVDHDAPVAVYFPYIVPRLWDADLLVRRTLVYLIRVADDRPGAVVAPARAVVHATNPNLPLANVRTLQEIADRSMTRTSFALVLLAIAATVALVLGAIGVYGVLSWIVAQRTREIGVRVALGARTGDVRRMVLRQGLTITGIGLTIGLAAAALLSRLMASLLFGVSPLDPATFALVALTIMVVALLASAIPAARAARLDPIDALRRE